MGGLLDTITSATNCFTLMWLPLQSAQRVFVYTAKVSNGDGRVISGAFARMLLERSMSVHCVCVCVCVYVCL